MDWPVIGSLTGVAVLASVLGVGTYAALSSGPPAAAAAPRAPALIAFGPSRLPINSWAKPANPGPATPSLSRLTVQDVNHFASANPTVPAVPQLQSEPRYRPELRKRRVASLPTELSPQVPPPPAAAAPAPRPAPQPAEVARPAPRKPVDPPRAKPVDHRVMTAGKIAQLRRALRLLPDQTAHWPAVAVVLREIGREQLAQIRSGGKPEVGTGLMMRLYYAAQPLLGVLQPDQKERVRGMARSLGYGSVASKL